MSLTKILVAAAFVSLGWTSHASAAAITSGSSLASGEAGPVGAALVVSTGAQVLSAPTFTGTLTSSVFTNDSSNPYGLNALTFTYLITNDAGSPNHIDRLTISDFTGYLTDVSYDSAGTGIIPFSVDRNTTDVVGFTFVTPPVGSGDIAPGATSRFLVVQTDATSYSPSIASAINSTSAIVLSYAPLPASGGAPEPGTLAIAILGVTGLMFRKRKI